MEDGWKDVLWIVLCVVIHEIILVHTKRHVTLNIFEHHCSRHAPRWKHVTLPFHAIEARPVIIVISVQSSDVSRSWGWSPYMHGWSWLMPSPCQHLSDKGEMKISVKFSFHQLKIKGCICWQWPGLTGGKRAFRVEGKVSTGRVVAVDLPHYQHHHHLQSCWRKNLGLEAVILKTVAKVGVAHPPCPQNRNIFSCCCLNPLRFLVFVSETAHEHCNATTGWNSKLSTDISRNFSKAVRDNDPSPT